jgi:hypothetical protein
VHRLDVEKGVSYKEVLSVMRGLLLTVPNNEFLLFRRHFISG